MAGPSRRNSLVSWAAQGTTDPTCKRTAPSAGALYPLQVHALTPEGTHHYRPQGHELALLSTEDGATPVGAFDKEELMELAMLPADHEPVYVIPVGHPS